MESGLLFYVFAAVATASAISVVLQRKVYYSAISLIVCLCAIAALYLLLDAQFIAAVQVIVYAGAIMVLFLFVIMLLDPFSATALRDKRRYLAYLGFCLGGATLLLLVPMLRVYSAVHTVRLARASMPGSTSEIGRALFRDYLLPFEATSALILVAIIGAVVLAKRTP